MTQFSNYFYLFILFAIIGCQETEQVSPQNTSPSGTTTTEQVITGNTKFALDLYKEVVDENENQMLSPYSISTALAMVYAGADGNTATEMQNVLGFGANNSSFHQAYNQVTNTIERNINNAQNNEINIINKIWRHTTFDFLSSFENIMNNDYFAPVAAIDFRQKAAASQIINKWVDQETHQLIPELLPDDAITDQTVSVLVNAIYFKADWEQQFFHYGTQSLPFTTSKGTTKNIDMMSDDIYTNNLKFTEDADAEVLELFFKDKQSSIVLILPKDQTMGINNFVQQVLSKTKVDQWLNNLAAPAPNNLFTIKMPKWDFKSDFQLNTPLINLGIKDAFSISACNLSKMAKSSINVDKVLHKTVIEVHEGGIEAATATPAFITLNSAPPIIRTFTADRPFVFMVKDTETNSILFIGHVQDPSS